MKALEEIKKYKGLIVNMTGSIRLSGTKKKRAFGDGKD